MAKDSPAGARWKGRPAAYTYPAAASYLSLLFPATAVDGVIASLRTGGDVEHPAKDLLRAARQPLLPRDEPEVKKALKKVANGRKLSPVLLVRGDGSEGIPLTIADGYSRICASYHLDEDSVVPCRIADRPSIESIRPVEAPLPVPDAATSRLGARLLTAGKLIGMGLLLLLLVELRRVIRRRRSTRARWIPHLWPAD